MTDIGNLKLFKTEFKTRKYKDHEWETVGMSVYLLAESEEDIWEPLLTKYPVLRLNGVEEVEEPLIICENDEEETTDNLEQQ